MDVLLIILGIVMLFYGVCVAMARAGTRFYMVWLTMGFMAFAYGICDRMGLISNIPIAIRAVSYAVLFAVAALVFISVLFVLSGFKHEEIKHADVVIVLGAQIIDERPSIVLKKRLDTAAEYLMRNTDCICIVSGGQGANEIKSEAEIMRKYLVEGGIEEKRIILEDKSKNTTENIRFSMPLIPCDYKAIGIVTSNFHIYRGVSIAKKAGISSAFGIAAPSDVFYLPTNVFREGLALIKEKLARNA